MDTSLFPENWSVSCNNFSQDNTVEIGVARKYLKSQNHIYTLARSVFFTVSKKYTILKIF